jgi:hypothetical protein
MSVAEEKLLRLVKAAPSSTESLLKLLLEGLDWPIPAGMDLDDVPLDWSLDDLHLDPERVARLRSIKQIPRLVHQQKFGVFVLNFEGGTLPIGAVRRVVDRLVATARTRKHHGTVPTWALDELIFFCQTRGSEPTLHVVALRESDGRRQVRVSSWSKSAPEARLELVLRRTIPELSWSTEAGGPAIGVDLGQRAFHGYRYAIKTSDALAKRMAEVARDVRDEVLALYEVETDFGPVRTLYRELREQLIADLTPERFADVYAQTMVYGLLTARIAHPEKFVNAASVDVLDFENPFLDAIYARFRSTSDSEMDIDELGLGELAEELAETDIDEVLADFGAKNRRDDPVVHFYEDFLARYDNRQKVALGAFFTPTPVVQYIIRSTDYAVQQAFDLPDGIASKETWREYEKHRPGFLRPKMAKPGDRVVRMLDPATGTGTFLVEWLRHVSRTIPVDLALDSIAALEISLASYAVAHLKVSMEAPGAAADHRLPIYLADTLAPSRPHVFDEMKDPVSAESTLADQVKYATVHNVIIGNPPYDRVERDGAGGFVMEPQRDGRSLFDDILDPAKEHTIFSHHASLYNLYVYFWRWALWKGFEEQDGPAVVSFITGSSWLTGPGFVGLREMARRMATHIDIVDLGGDNKGARKEENVFDIETPVAIVTLRRGPEASVDAPAKVRYRRISGTRQEKLQSLTDLDPGTNVGWTSVEGTGIEPLAPPSGGVDWNNMPALVDLVPWQQPGCKYGRTWPISPDPSTLERRWRRLLKHPGSLDQDECFVTPSSGRNARTSVAGMQRICDLSPGEGHEPIVRYGYRSFDRQWAFDDPRMAKTDSPSLWQSISDHQIFLVSKPTFSLGIGPAATATAFVPDLDSFRGSFGGKDVFPMYRDVQGTPNVDPTLLAAIESAHQKADPQAKPMTIERLFGYIYSLLAGADYTERFRSELSTPGPRVPLTADPDVFAEVSGFGAHLLWLHTYGERFKGHGSRGGISIPRELKWLEPVRNAPDTSRDVAYVEADRQLRVGDGIVAGVRPEVWAFEVSGMPVVKKWLGYRTKKGAGKAASSKSPLDAIRPETWLDEWNTELLELLAVLDRTIELRGKGVALLDRVMQGPLIAAAELPSPPDRRRQPPKASRSDELDTLFGD